MKTDFTRQLDILSPSELVYPVTIVGAGGIGSPVALCLAKMGFSRISVYDPDFVEDINVPNQIYRPADIGSPKVDALGSLIAELTGTSITVHQEKFEGQRLLEGIVVSAVDRMEMRMIVWKAVRYNTGVQFFVDGRTGGEVLQVFSAVPYQIEDVELYESMLFPDEEAAELPCTARSIFYVGFIIAGLICLNVKLWVRQQQYGRQITYHLVPGVFVSQE
ncbi:MAG: hypothetical protein A2939_02865 [Parcubacteria group bacterium RIFCSPLOWO2_01_FULL_48_18]|nr:MAG: hypothetical protein A2939_02865 [Parcubacteria group bacterium RIFCSPLOWO2_01_FULL_48_18]OHB23025.1 MAG: hypothetical protein A3J67_04015 [Parcubacteria group bacterium RIFCSPHIGHO2_02_FULL_48_10b]